MTYYQNSILKVHLPYITDKTVQDTDHKEKLDKRTGWHEYRGRETGKYHDKWCGDFREVILANDKP